jgi:hypothetical protein
LDAVRNVARGWMHRDLPQASSSRSVSSGGRIWSILQISAYGASDRAAFAAVFKLTHYPISPEISPSLNGGYGWLEVECNCCKTRASLPAVCDTSAARYANLETGSGAEMSVM